MEGTGKAAALPQRGDFEPPASSPHGDPVCAASGGGRALACPVPPALVSPHFTSLAFRALISPAVLSRALAQAAAETPCALPARELCNYFAGADARERPLPQISVLGLGDSPRRAAEPAASGTAGTAGLGRSPVLPSGGGPGVWGLVVYLEAILSNGVG